VTGETRSYAENLALSLRALGYSHIQVTGYLGSVYSDYAERKLGMLGDYTGDKHKGVIVNGVVWPTYSQKSTF
jgi:hypothetical protein